MQDVLTHRSWLRSTQNQRPAARYQARQRQGSPSHYPRSVDEAGRRHGGGL